MTDRRTALTRAGVRVLAGAAGLAASAAVVIAVVTVPLPSAQAQPKSSTVTPVPATAYVACPGPLLTLGSDTSTTALSALTSPSVVSGGDSAYPAQVPLTASDVQGSTAAPKAFEEPASDSSHEPLLTAAQSATAKSSDLSGFAAASCAQPDFEQWLVGGATSLGATTLLVLSNPGDVAATVSVAVYSEQGLAPAAGGSGILVQPHTQHIVPLSGLAPNASATVVHVTSTGGTVSAQLQESEVTGVTPQGADWIGPGAIPSTRLVIPGAVIGASGASASAGEDAGDGGGPVLRVLPVGNKDAKLTIGVRADNGGSGGSASTATASHGVVSEIPLPHVAAGTYTITIDSDEPLVAAAHTTTSDATAGTDYAWYASARALTGSAAMPVAAGPKPTLHLVNTSDSAVALKLQGKDGGTITVPAGASVSRAETDAGILTTTDAHGLYASVSYAGPGELAAYPVYPTSSSASALTVYPR